MINQPIIGGRRRSVTEPPPQYKPARETWVICGAEPPKPPPQRKPGKGGKGTGQMVLATMEELRKIILRRLESGPLPMDWVSHTGALSTSPGLHRQIVLKMKQEGLVELVGWWMAKAPLTKAEREALRERSAPPAEGTHLYKLWQAIPEDQPIPLGKLAGRMKEDHESISIQVDELLSRRCIKRMKGGFRRLEER